MSNKKQNSIDWLIEQMIKYELVPKGIHFNNILFHQAKAMHKEEIEDAYGHGQNVLQVSDGAYDKLNY